MRPCTKHNFVRWITATENCIEIKRIPMHNPSTIDFMSKLQMDVLKVLDSARGEVYQMLKWLVAKAIRVSKTNLLLLWVVCVKDWLSKTFISCLFSHR